VRILGELVRSGRRGIGVHGDNASRRKRTHVQPYGGRARTAVVNERDGALAQILNVAARVGGVIDQRSRFILSFFKRWLPRSLCRDVLAADFDVVLSDGRFFFWWRSGGGFGGLVGRFGIFILPACCCGSRGEGQGKRK